MAPLSLLKCLEIPKKLFSLQHDLTLSVSEGQSTTAGAKDINDDVIGIRIPDDDELATKGIAAVIADGVSAASAGHDAAETCVQGFLSDYYSTPDTWSVKTSGHKVITALNRWLYGQTQSAGYVDEKRVCHYSQCVDFKVRYRLSVSRRGYPDLALPKRQARTTNPGSHHSNIEGYHLP